MKSHRQALNDLVDRELNASEACRIRGQYKAAQKHLDAAKRFLEKLEELEGN